MRLQDKVAIVTGGANGMGAAEVTLFTREGAKVAIADVAEEQGKRLEGEVRAAGGEAIFVPTDVTREKDWRALLQATLSAFGRVDILVNNAGLSSSSEADPASLDGWGRIMGVNATGVFLGTMQVIPEMQRGAGGSIVNISSIMGIVGSERGHPAYHASKGAVRSFTKAMAVRYGPAGIRVNSVHPGFMPPMTSSEPRTPEEAARLARATPLRRNGEAVEVARGVLFLASDDASFVTGAELVIDGGFTVR